MEDVNDPDRRFAVDLNNEVWSHLDAGHISVQTEEREQLLYAAYASAHHWRVVGTVANRARAEHLIARAACVAGFPYHALHHAQRCVELVEAHGDEMADWDLGFALEALARAQAANGELDAARATYARATDVAAAIEDIDDRTVVMGELTREPWFGLRDEPSAD